MKLPLSIEELRENLIQKDYNCVDLTNEYLKRIERLNPNLNALITISDDAAFKKAKEMDLQLSLLGKNAFEQFPLLGVTVIHKDMFMTKGVRTTAGAKILRDYIPQYSATVVDKLDSSGAIMLGKANQDAWAHGSSGENSDFGSSKNPWNLNYVPGGSSSGSAVSVSADFSLISTGTDTCGSIRLPASFCGVIGFKPTYGAVSRYGVIAMASSLDSVGHFTNYVSDAEIVYSITKGQDNKDSTLKEDSLNYTNKKYSIGVPKEFLSQGVDNEVKKVIEQAIDVYKKLGYTIKNVSLPHTKYAIAVYYIIQPAEVSSNLGRYDGIRYGMDRTNFSEEAKRRIMLGSYVLSAGYYDDYYLKAMKVRSVIINELNDVYKDVDVLIAPISPTAAFKLGEKASDPLKMYLSDIFAATANLSGTPAIAIPFGRNKLGLPLGFQLMGQRFSENILFGLGKVFQKETNYQPLKPTINI